MPLAAMSFGNMLIAVKPGMVLISLTKSSPVDRLSRKSTRARPAPSIASNASSACCWMRARSDSLTPAGISVRDPVSMYLAS